MPGAYVRKRGMVCYYAYVQSHKYTHLYAYSVLKVTVLYVVTNVSDESNIPL